MAVVDSEACITLGIDIGGTGVRYGVFKGDKLIEDGHLPSHRDEEPEALADELSRLILDKDPDICGIGAPGMVAPWDGVVRYPPNFPRWREFPLKKVLEQKTGSDVWVVNDGVVNLLGEWRYGAGRGYNNVLMLTLGTGVGGGLVADGRVVWGSEGCGLEVGHISINPDGPRCRCGNYGCVERYIGAEYIIERAVGLMGEYSGSVLSGKQDLTLLDLADAAEGRDLLALRVWRQTGEYLAYAIVSYIHLFAPKIIVIGGGIANSYRFMKGVVDEILSERVMMYERRGIKVCQAELGEMAGVYGGYILATEGEGLWHFSE
ncbi:MAG: hypothetical protein DRH49_05560 [Candidatus Coatesbacteria bacterium]|nr:MAG: hypothetical protein DRH49_05560 [Candidatus Coatesbacteria bacterium]